MLTSFSERLSPCLSCHWVQLTWSSEKPPLISRLTTSHAHSEPISVQEGGAMSSSLEIRGGRMWQGRCMIPRAEYEEGWVSQHLFLKPGFMHAKSPQSCSTLCSAMNCSPPGSSVHWSLQARILEWVAIPSSKGSSWPGIFPHLLRLLRGQTGSLPLLPPGKPKLNYNLP